MQAQRWNDLSPVLEQADSTVRDSFLQQLEQLSASPDVDEIHWPAVLDSLFSTNLAEGTFGSPVDSFITEWGVGRDSLISWLVNAGIGSADSLGLVGQYDDLNEIWYETVEDFNNALITYDDDITFNPAAIEEGEERIEISSGLQTQAQANLRRSVAQALAGTDAQGIGGFTGLLNTLFSDIFDLELAYGIEDADVSYYNFPYAATAKTIRVGSMPQFDKTWEARWHVQAGFSKTTEVPLVESALPDDGHTPFRYNGNFSFMFNPALGRLRAGGSVRLYSSLGMEVDAYVPAHADAAPPFTNDNVGKTTGFGPQIGTGFIVQTHAVTFYTYATKTLGTVANSPGYQYHAQAIHAGVKLGNIMNVRYDIGKASWAPNEQKTLTYNRLTLGLRLASLYR